VKSFPPLPVFWTKAKTYLRKSPQWLGPLGGGLAGIFAGVFGVIIGVLMGYMLQELFRQSGSDSAIIEYFENPGPVNFYEGEPGLAAYCALAVVVAFQSFNSGAGGREFAVQDAKRLRERGIGAFVTEAAEQSAVSVLPSRPELDSLIESFCRLAWTRRPVLNPDLLAESLAARCEYGKQLTAFVAGIERLALSPGAWETAGRIRAVLAPGSEPPPAKTGEAAPDPWEVLGLPPDSSLEEVKSGFRKLALQFHPDSLQALDEMQRQYAGRIFIMIQEAYQEILRQRKASDE
jgi:DnaJ like chaperone protein